MKRILIIILIVLLVALGISIIFDGVKIGSFEILGYRNLGKADQILENKIQESTTLTSVTFPEKVSSLTTASKQLVNAREKYQDKVAYSSEEDVKRANEIETYKVDFLFTRLGNHAKKYGLVIDLDAKQSTVSGVYNLNFTVHGKYSLISEFVRAVENDEDLTFTIDSFDLVLETAPDILKATFTVPELRLDIDDSIANSSNIVPMGNNATNNTNTTNTTNNANNSNTTNTTNTTNKANTTNNTTNAR